jgi:hypothetical protein
MLKKRFISICIFLGLLLGSVRAQVPEDYISISFQTMSWDRVVQDVYYTSVDGEGAIFSPNASFSRSQTYVGPRELKLYRKKKTEEGFVEVPVAFTTFPVAAKGHYILVLIQDSAAEEERYRIYPIAFDSRRGKPNQVTLINLSLNKMVGRIDDAKFELSAGRIHTVDVHPNSGGNVLAQFLLETEEGWKPLYSNNWRVHAGKQVFAFIARKDEHTRKINVRLIFQEYTAEKKESDENRL